MQRFVSLSLAVPVAAVLAAAPSSAAATPGLDMITHSALVITEPFDGHQTLDLLFSTSTPLTREKDDEGTVRFPGGVGVNSTAFAQIFAVEKSVPARAKAYCYAAAAGTKVGDGAKPGQLLHTQIVLSDTAKSPRLRRDLHVRKATQAQVAKQFGC